MKVLVMVALLAALVYRTSSADMCDVLSQDPTRVEMIYVCIEALASPKLKTEIYHRIKTYYPCDKTYVCFVRIACLNPPYDDFIYSTLKKDGDSFCEFRRWSKICQKREPEGTYAVRSNALVQGRYNLTSLN
ncbi:uncharacterized protein LOC115324685 [Ixodes scapularis]|uniref:uncharacterized protein LOC115324685 n=1 Tax=Ixodes scapularis TaxID=6945 RepID=UPI001A9E6B42|nr:uncharacterized protein LOC115324685 [Ixodes scapularis]